MTVSYDCNQLTIFHEASNRSNYNLSVISGNEKILFPEIRQKYLRKILKIQELVICHINLGIEVLKNRERDAIIVHGFSTEFLFFTYISSLFYTKNVYFLTHHNVQQAYQNLIVRFLFKFYHTLKYQFIINENVRFLENLNLNQEYINRNLSLLHPVAKINSSDLQEYKNKNNILNKNIVHKKRIGIIGKLRQEKQLNKTLSLLVKLQKELDFLLVIGTNDFSLLEQFNLFDSNQDEILILDTSEKQDYLNALDLCDIIVLNYEKSKYYYRCSGVAADAIGARTYVVCPDFPMMSFQVNYPSRVGLVYGDESELEVAVREALQLIPPSRNPAFEAHYNERSIQKISSTLVENIESRIDYK